MPHEEDHEIFTLKNEIKDLETTLDLVRADCLKWRNRARGWENAARNADNRYNTLRSSLQDLINHYAEANSHGDKQEEAPAG
jgi:hypothetical protein